MLYRNHIPIIHKPYTIIGCSQESLENLTLKQLIDFLRKVESSKVLARTKSLYIKKNLTNTEMLDSVVEIHNPKINQS